MWQAVAAVAALVTALAGGTVGIAGFVRSSRTEEARQRADDVEREVNRRVDAQQVGLDYMQKAMAALQETNLRQQGEIGELRGQLKTCHDEREVMKAEISALRERLG